MKAYESGDTWVVKVGSSLLSSDGAGIDKALIDNWVGANRSPKKTREKDRVGFLGCGCGRREEARNHKEAKLTPRIASRSGRTDGFDPSI